MEWDILDFSKNTFIYQSYLLLINFSSFVIMGVDKWSARRALRRVPEKTLFFLACFGGATGIYFAMKLFRHKTMHRSFNFGIPALIFLNIAFILGLKNLTQ